MDQIPPPRPLHRPFAGSGGLSIDGLAPEQGGAGLVANDTTDRGFWARVTAHSGQGNRYGFVRVDETDPETFPRLLGVGQQPTPFDSTGETTDAPAYEVTGRTDVPADGTVVVWLEPLQGGVAGFGFTYAARPAVTTGFVELADDVELDLGHNSVLSLTLSEPGTYLVSGAILGRLTASIAGPGLGASVTARFTTLPGFGVVYQATERLAAFAGVDGVLGVGSATMLAVVTLGGGSITLTLEATLAESTPGSVTSNLVQAAGTRIDWVKIA